MNKALACCVLLLLAPSCWAISNCRMSSGPPLAMGGYDVTSFVPADSQTTVVMMCDATPANIRDVTVTVGPGRFSNATSRRMALAGSGADFLSYLLFLDSGRTQSIGTSGATATVAVPVVRQGQSATANLVLYGRVPAQQDVTVGDYGDTLQITITP